MAEDMLVFGFFSTEGLKLLCKVPTETGVASCDNLMAATEELLGNRLGRSAEQFTEMMHQMLIEKLMVALDDFTPLQAPNAPEHADFEAIRFVLVTRKEDTVSIKTFQHEDRFKAAITSFIDLPLFR
ncbi:MAG: hypothetical protein LLG14_11650, partial [Nocardiaceae bacterium]|nr:hypothetical protein [Nocardiaceae bacterium]